MQVNIGAPPEEPTTTTGTSLVAGDNTSAATTSTDSTALVDASSELPEGATHDKESGEFCVAEGMCFNLLTEQGRIDLIKHMAESQDSKLLTDIQSYIQKHHPDDNVAEILGQEIVNTILAGFFSGRLGTGGAGPLTTTGQPPVIDVTVDKDTAEYFLKAAVSMLGHGVQFGLGAINAGIQSITGMLPDLPGSLTDADRKRLEKGRLVSKDSFWGQLPDYLKSWVGYEEHGDGTATIGGQTTANAAGELTGDVLALIVGPGKAKGLAKQVVKVALGRKPKGIREQLSYALLGAADYVRKGYGASNVGKGKGLVDKLFATRDVGRYKLFDTAGYFAPLAAEWTVAEDLAMEMFDKYGTELSEADRDAWATWFAFNYVWADMTVQLIDGVMGFVYSLRGQRKSDVRTIHGLILKVIFAEILTGAQIIGGIGITKIQKGEISPAEYVTALINLDFKAAGFDKPVTINEVLQALGGADLSGTPGSGTDFDVIEFEGKQYTITPPSTIIDDKGKKVPRGSALGNKIWKHWEETAGSLPTGEQVIAQNKGGLIATAKRNAVYRARGGLIAY